MDFSQKARRSDKAQGNGWKKDFQRLTKEVSDLGPGYAPVVALISDGARKLENSATAASALSDLKLAVIQDPDRVRGERIVEFARMRAAERKLESDDRDKRILERREELRSQPSHPTV